jgi:gamma-glutamyltranspeptidase/glutathione hydrolase
VERDAVCVAFHRQKLCSFPPPSYGGVAVLEILAILKGHGSPSRSFLDVTFVHQFVEAGRLAEADRLAFVGDPDTGTLAARRLLDPGFVRTRASRIRDDAALADPVQSGAPLGFSQPECTQTQQVPAPSTSQVSIADAFGNALAMTTTINVNFGSWLTVDGFFLNNAMTNFALPADGHCPTNAPAGARRPVTAMTPIIGTDANDRVVLIGGSAGAGKSSTTSHRLSCGFWPDRVRRK